MTPHHNRDLYRGFDDGWTRAIEMALTPIVVGGVGYLLDRVAGTVPLFTIVLLVMAVVATFVKMYYAYDTKMKAHDAESPWGRARARADQVRAVAPQAEVAPQADPAHAQSGRTRL